MGNLLLTTWKWFEDGKPGAFMWATLSIVAIIVFVVLGVMIWRLGRKWRTKIAADAATPVNCIGSHIEGEDRTLQLIALPQSMATSMRKPMNLIFVRFLTQVSELEKERIMEELENAYLAI